MKQRMRVIVFGAGDCGRRRSNEIDADVVCFVDNDLNKQGIEFCGRPVVPLSDIHAFEYDCIIIASIYEPEIRRQLIQIGLEDKISSTFEFEKSAACLPVNYNDFDCSKEKIQSDARYAYDVAQAYLSKFSGEISGIRGKSILELGPGVNFGSALILICFGAKKVTVSDRFLVKYSDEYHSKVYGEIINLLIEHNDSIDVGSIKNCIESKSHNIKQLITVECPLEKIAEFFVNEFDITTLGWKDI